MYCVVMDYVLQGANDTFTLSPIYDTAYEVNFQVKQKHRYHIPSDDAVYAIGPEFSVGDIVCFDQKTKKISKPVYDKSYDTVRVNSMKIEDVLGSDKKRKMLGAFGMKLGLREIWVYSDDAQYDNIQVGQELLVQKGVPDPKVIRNLTIENGISQFVKKHYSKTI